MPLYEFECKKCRRQISELMSIEEYEKLLKNDMVFNMKSVVVGPKVLMEAKSLFSLVCLCGSALERKFSSFIFEMK